MTAPPVVVVLVPDVVRNYDNLVDYEFERLVGGLFGAIDDARYERFARGPDGGVDLRHIGDGGRVSVIQAKHYKGSTYSDLKSAVKKEKSRIEKMKPRPASYRLVTSQSLTPRRKSELAGFLRPYVDRDDQIYGREDIDDLLDGFPAVERSNIKLSLSSATQLKALLNSGVHARSRQLALEIARALPLWVEGASHQKAREILFEHNVCVIAGEPGIGKTTLGRMLTADAIARDFEPIEISGDIAEAWEVFEPEVPQIFFYDDFLGHTTLLELTKNEDSRLVSFMRAVTDSPRTLFVLTTREYILQRAVFQSEAFRREGLAAGRFLLSIGSYSRIDRGKILYNHAWHSLQLEPSAREQLSKKQGYRKIVDHPNFSPRLVEYITGLQRGHTLPVNSGEPWLAAAVDALDHPESIWRHGYAVQIGPAERALLVALVTLPSHAQQDDLREAHESLCHYLQVDDAPRLFETALRILDDTFVRTARRGEEPIVELLNPGLADFLQRELLDDPRLVTTLLDAARFFEQLMSLGRLATDKPDSRLADAFLGARLVPALDRLLRSPTAVWIDHELWDGQVRYRRWRPSVESRLSSCVDLARLDRAPNDLVSWVADQLVAQVEVWRGYGGDPWGMNGLAKRLAMASPPLAPVDWAVAMKDSLRSDPYQAEIWGFIKDLHDLAPDAFEPGEWDDVRGSYVAWAHHELSHNAAEMRSDDEVHTIESIAEDMELQLDHNIVVAALDTVSERLAQEDADEEERLERWRDERRPESDVALLNLDDLFSSFDS